MSEDQRVLDDDRPEAIDPTLLLCRVPGIQADLVADCEAEAVCYMKHLCAFRRIIDDVREGPR